MLTNECGSEHSGSCQIDIEASSDGSQNMQCSAPFGLQFGSVDEVEARDRGKIGYFDCLKSLFKTSYEKLRSDDSIFDQEQNERGPLFLSVSSLPEWIRETVFDNGKINVENWEALNEAIMWLAGLKTSDSGFSLCCTRQLEEYTNILRIIIESCMSREDLLHSLHLK